MRSRRGAAAVASRPAPGDGASAARRPRGCRRAVGAVPSVGGSGVGRSSASGRPCPGTSTSTGCRAPRGWGSLRVLGNGPDAAAGEGSGETRRTGEALDLEGPGRRRSWPLATLSSVDLPAPSALARRRCCRPGTRGPPRRGPRSARKRPAPPEAEAGAVVRMVAAHQLRARFRRVQVAEYAGLDGRVGSASPRGCLRR